jgi:hypothetical protein
MPTDTAQLAGRHDLRLSAWGPYTKRYIGISHVPDAGSGLRFDLSVFPGLYRRKVDVPNVTWESGYHPWEAAADLSYYRHRHELVWKDRVYCDIDFCRLDRNAALVRCACVNRTTARQNLVLHYMASLHFPPLRTNSNEPVRPYRVRLPAGAVWVDGLDYDEVHYAGFDPRANLTEDGQIRGEVRDHSFVGGQGLGQGFAKREGDAATYRFSIADDVGETVLLLRYRMRSGDCVSLTSTGMIDQKIVLAGSGGFSLVRIDVGALRGGEKRLVLTSNGGAAVEIDGLALVPLQREEEIAFEPVTWNPTPERLEGPREDTMLLRYEHLEDVYGLAWGAEPFQVREFICDDLDVWMRYRVHDHVSDVLRGPGDGHFTNVFMRPIFLEPESERVIFGLVASGDAHAVRERLATFDPTPDRWQTIHQQARARAVDLAPEPAGEMYRFSQERMAATVLTNVVYPVRTRGTWIRHCTPGRWWDSLYTWDSGFIGLGLLELDVERAVDNLNAYVTEPGERDAAFIHHGSPVPTQFYLFLELWNRTQSRELLGYFYPRLQQYHRFLAGRLGSSTTRTLKSNLIRTWDYFYNSGGWDDYAPQVFVHQRGLEASVTPVVSTAHVIRTAKILRMAGLALGEDVTEYDEDITLLAEALQTYAWDEESGYFGYVCHDDEGWPTGILRHESGINFNMGLGGASPLVGGVCTPEQESRLLGYLVSDTRLWSRFGISTVDQSAPYYRDDGYWNGAVWMPHQWFFWKALLDMGEAKVAHRVAHTALELWKREVERSYNCFEHFIVQSGRGAGWHHFGGLSSPVLCWYGAYHRSGRLTTGLNVWVESSTFDAGNRALSAQLTLHSPPHQAPVVITTMAGGPAYNSTWKGQPVEHNERYSGVLEIRLPTGAGQGVLEVFR